MPTTMRYIDAPQPGDAGVLVLADGPAPSPAPGEVLIRVQAAGVNRPDVLQREGKYAPPPGANPVLGLEVAGVVAAVGAEAQGWQVGDRVCALTNGGGYAEYCAAPAGQCLPWPAGYGAVEAAALPETYFTVWANLFGLGGLRQGGTALVHGGSSGIGARGAAEARAQHGVDDHLRAIEARLRERLGHAARQALEVLARVALQLAGVDGREHAHRPAGLAQQPRGDVAVAAVVAAAADDHDLAVRRDLGHHPRQARPGALHQHVHCLGGGRGALLGRAHLRRGQDRLALDAQHAQSSGRR